MTTRSPVRRSGQGVLPHACWLESASNLTNPDYLLSSNACTKSSARSSLLPMFFLGCQLLGYVSRAFFFGQVRAHHHQKVRCHGYTKEWLQKGHGQQKQTANKNKTNPPQTQPENTQILSKTDHGEKVKQAQALTHVCNQPRLSLHLQQEIVKVHCKY